MPSLQQNLVLFFDRYLSAPELQAPSAHPTRMPLFSPTDLPYLLLLGPQTGLGLFGALLRYKKSWGQLEWTSLADIYPRGLMFLYFFFLWNWEKFNRPRVKITAHPLGAILGEVFIRYICELDSQIDRLDGVTNLRARANFARQAPASQKLIAEFLCLLRQCAYPRATQREILRYFQVYRQQYLRICWQNAQKTELEADLEEVLREKSAVAGDLWAVWADLLCLAYQIPAEQRQTSHAVFHAFGMVTQVFDDMSDLNRDLLEFQPNIFYALCLHFPAEAQLLRTHLAQRTDRFVSLVWEALNLPQATRAAMQLVAGYLNLIRAADAEARISPALERCSRLLQNRYLGQTLA